MIWELVKRETAWRELYGYIGIVALMSVLLPENASSIFIFVVGLCWVRSLPAERASLFQAALPISAADLFLSRALAFGALIWLPATAGTAILLLSGHTENVGVMLTGGAVFSVLVLVALSHRVRELAGSHFIPPIAITILCVVAVPVIRYVPLNVVAILCSMACVLLFAAIWLRLPPSFEVVASKPAAAAPSDPPREVAASRRAPARSFLKHWVPVLRCAFPPTAFMFLPIIVLASFGGQWFYASSQALFPLIGALSRITWLRGLPVSRSTLLTILVAPWLLALTLNVLAGSLFFPRAPLKFDYLGSNASSLRPPLEYWKIAPNGIAPLIQAPWQETWRPPIQLVGGVAIYNPYSTGATNSRQFFEWQYRRGTVAIYGRGVEFADYRRPVTLRPIEQQERFVVLNIAACLCWLLLMLNALLLMMHWRTNRVFSRASYFASFLVLLPMLVPLSLDLIVKHPGDSLGSALFKAGLLGLLDILPEGVVPVLFVAIVPLGILWWSALRLFEGVEPQPADPTVRA